MGGVVDGGQCDSSLQFPATPSPLPFFSPKKTRFLKISKHQTRTSASGHLPDAQLPDCRANKLEALPTAQDRVPRMASFPLCNSVSMSEMRSDVTSYKGSVRVRNKIYQGIVAVGGD